MIKSITIQKGCRGQFTNKLYIRGGNPRTFEFTDGVNIITGRNGSGKSVLLKIIKTLCGIGKDYTHAVMARPMDISKEFFSGEGYYTFPEYIKKNLDKKGYPEANLDWDGSFVHYLTPERFNPKNLWDIFNSPKLGGQELLGMGEVMLQFMDNRSAGEGGIYLLGKLLNLTQKYPAPIKNMNDVWRKADNIFHEWLNSMPKDGKPTLLIDELDDRLDLDNQKGYWDYITHLTKAWQVIVVSHSYFAFKLKNVNHIPLNRTYFNKIKNI